MQTLSRPRILVPLAPFQSSPGPYLLETVEIETAPSVDAAIIWLHGLGADAHDFEPVVPELLPKRERAWRFVFPNAPVRPVTINGGMRMRAWYDIHSFDRSAAEDASGFEASARDVTELIAREVGRGIEHRRIVLAGFSQGGAVCLYTAPRYPQRLAGVMALSCYLPLAARLAADRVPANDAVPLFMAHGLADPVIPAPLAIHSRDLLRSAGYQVEWHEYPMAHAVCPAEIAAIRAFLLRILS
jgi:phospholipase/carboxylesterase